MPRLSTPTYIYIPNKDTKNNALLTCIKKETPTRKYFFFAESENNSNVYVIKTNWVVKHHYLIKQSIINDGAYIFDGNPFNFTCGFAYNRNYKWENDEVYTIGNTSLQMDIIASKAVSTSTSIEWVLVFSWLWVPIGLAIIIPALLYIFDIIREKYRPRPSQHSLDNCYRA